jgi:hypothetical protein
MRVITGKAKGRKLMMVPGAGTRPITDRAKEALFSIMGNWIEATRVLDLFGGTGGVGIESLSRGASVGRFYRPRPPGRRNDPRQPAALRLRAPGQRDAPRQFRLVCNAITARLTT